MIAQLNVLAMTLSIWAPRFQLGLFIIGASLLSLVVYLVGRFAVLFPSLPSHAVLTVTSLRLSSSLTH